MLADAFFFLPFPFLLCLFLILCFFLCFFFLKNHTRLPPRRHRTVQNLLPIFFKWNTSLTPYTGMIKPQPCRHTGNKTTNLPPHRRNTKLQACRPRGVNTKQQAYSLTGNKTSSSLFFVCLFVFFFSFLFSPPHRRSTKLQACCHTGIIQTTSLLPHRHNTNFKLAAPQA